MSKERDVVTPTGDKPFTAEQREKQLSRQEKKAKLAAVLERGIVRNRLEVNLPDDLYGEWVPRDTAEMERKKILGFRVDTEYGAKHGLHTDASGAVIIGDCVLMVCDRETKEIIDELSRERYNEIHNPKKLTKEEREYRANASNEPQYVPTFVDSKTDAATIDDVKAAVDAANRLNTPAI